MDDIDAAVNEHLKSIDKKIGGHIDELLLKGDISEVDFEIHNNDKFFTIRDQDNVEIIYNYTLRKVYSYGGNVNTNKY